MEKKVVITLLFLLIFPALILILSGDYTWPEGWIFSVWLLILCFSVILYLERKDPTLLAERYRKTGTGEERGWDRVIIYGLLIGFILWIVIMPLDAKWFGWSPPALLWEKVVGGAGLVASFLLFFRSYMDNTFLSPFIRVRPERGQRVVSTGVYRIIRHPMYLGAILMFFSAPLLLGSLGGIIVGCALTILLMARIMAEESVLARELGGYNEYLQKVRYRLIPGIW